MSFFLHFFFSHCPFDLMSELTKTSDATPKILNQILVLGHDTQILVLLLSGWFVPLEFTMFTSLLLAYKQPQKTAFQILNCVVLVQRSTTPQLRQTQRGRGRPYACWWNVRKTGCKGLGVSVCRWHNDTGSTNARPRAPAIRTGSATKQRTKVKPMDDRRPCCGHTRY